MDPRSTVTRSNRQSWCLFVAILAAFKLRTVFVVASHSANHRFQGQVNPKQNKPYSPQFPQSYAWDTDILALLTSGSLPPTQSDCDRYPPYNRLCASNPNPFHRPTKHPHRHPANKATHNNIIPQTTSPKSVIERSTLPTNTRNPLPTSNSEQGVRHARNLPKSPTMSFRLSTLLHLCALLFLLAATASSTQVSVNTPRSTPSQPPSTLSSFVLKPTTIPETDYSCTRTTESAETQCGPGSGYDSLKKGGGHGGGRSRGSGGSSSGTVGQRPHRVVFLLAFYAFVLGCGWIVMT